jgi:lambda family phage portal protein
LARPTGSGKVGWFDRLVIGVAPGYGLRRVRARAAAGVVARHYDAAAPGRRTADWRRNSGDANAALVRSLAALRDLSRNLRRNNGWAKRAIGVIGKNPVGWGIQARAKAESPELAADALKLWNRWASSIRCDFDGNLPFTGLQRLVMETVAESGEALVIREPARITDRLSIPLRIRVIEPDYLATTKDLVPMDGGYVQNGIEFDGQGRRVAYWLYKNHPGSSIVPNIGVDRVPAADVIHVFRVDRPGQSRGVPWLAAAILKLNDFDDYDDAILLQQKIAACFAAFVENADPSSTLLGEQDDLDEKIEELEPGQIQYLAPGQKVTFATPPSVSDHTAFSTSALRRVAASLDITYEDLTGDYSQVNFSSARMARLSHWASVEDWRWNMLIPKLCDGVFAWAMEIAAGLNHWPEVPRAEWSAPPMPMLDPEKEVAATTKAIRAGLTTYPQALRELGYDPATVVAEIAASNEVLDENDIILDSDPRRTAMTGQAQMGGGDAAPPPARAEPPPIPPAAKPRARSKPSKSS